MLIFIVHQFRMLCAECTAGSIASSQNIVACIVVCHTAPKITGMFESFCNIYQTLREPVMLYLSDDVEPWQSMYTFD